MCVHTTTDLDVWGAVTRFRGPPFFPQPASPIKEEDETYLFAVFGDMGTAEEDGSLDFGGEQVSGVMIVMWLCVRPHLGKRQPCENEAYIDIAAHTKTHLSLPTRTNEQTNKQVASLNTTKLLLAALEHDQQPALSLVVHVGDLSYAEGYDAKWDEYFSQIEPVAKVNKREKGWKRYVWGRDVCL